MADIKSNYLRGKLLNTLLRNIPYSPDYLYLALFTEQAIPAGLQTGNLAHEVNVGAYIRQPLTFNAPSVSGEITNATNVAFPVATAFQGAIKAWAIMDALTVGNVLYYGDFDEKNGAGSGWKEIAIGDAFLVRAGDIRIMER